MAHRGFFHYVLISKVDIVPNQNEMVEITQVLEAGFESCSSIY